MWSNLNSHRKFSSLSSLDNFSFSPPPVNTVIVPSAQAQRPRVVPSRTATTIVPSAQNRPAPRPPIRPQNFQPSEDFPSLAASQPAFTAASGPHSNWRQEVQAVRNVQRGPAVQMGFTEQFPSLTSAAPVVNSAAEFPSLGSSAKSKKPASNIWAKGKPTALVSIVLFYFILALTTFIMNIFSLPITINNLSKNRNPLNSLVVMFFLPRIFGPKECVKEWRLV